MKIALCVTGSISAYKAYDLTRLLIKAEHQVRVILTHGALKFIRRETFSYLGAQKVYGPDDDFLEQQDKDSAGPVTHINLIKWADKMLVAPLSANTLSDFAHAKASNLLTSMFLAWDPMKPILLFPAMNTLMLEHPFTQENFQKIKNLPYVFLGQSASGLLACGDQGLGKLEHIETITALTQSFTLTKENKTLLLTAGATIAPLDSVRYLTNASTGKSAIPFIIEALSKGINTIVIAGRNATSQLESFQHHPLFQLIRVTTTNEMFYSVHKYFKKSDYYISVAAISDFHFPINSSCEKKLKKATLGQTLEILPSQDILKSIIDIKSPHQKIVGFAAETDLNDNVLKEKFKRKPVDLLVATQVSTGMLANSEPKGFGTDGANYRFLDSCGSISQISYLSKKQMAGQVLNQILQ